MLEKGNKNIILDAFIGEKNIKHFLEKKIIIWLNLSLSTFQSKL